MTRDHKAYIDFCRVPLGTRWIYVGNNFKVEVHGIGTCQLMLCSGSLLHDVLYAPNIRRDLVSILVLLSLGFNLSFYYTSLTISCDDVYYSSGFLSDGFMILDIDYGCCNVSCCFIFCLLLLIYILLI